MAHVMTAPHGVRRAGDFGIGIPVVRPDLLAVLVSGDARFAAREETSFRLTEGGEEIRASQVVVHNKSKHHPHVKWTAKPNLP